jgi:hypothetical protein
MMFLNCEWPAILFRPLQARASPTDFGAALPSSNFLHAAHQLLPTYQILGFAKAFKQPIPVA